MAVTAKEIKDCFAEFAGLSDTLVDKFRLQAERRVNLTTWQDKADDAILYLSAHLLKINKDNGADGGANSGPISKKRVGDLSVEFKVPEKVSDSWLARTSYGQTYMEIKRGIWGSRVLS